MKKFKIKDGIKTTKSLFCIMVTAIMMIPMFVCTSTYADNLSASDAIKVLVNEKAVDFDVEPVIKNGRTLVPFRKLLETMGATVDWDSDTKIVTCSKGDTKIKLTISETTAYVNEKAVTLDVPAEIIGNSTFVPLRFIGEGLNCDVDWNGQVSTWNVKTSTWSGPTSAIFITTTPDGFTKTSYKKIGTQEYCIYIKKPATFIENEKHPTIVYYFGGAWNTGNINQLVRYANEYASKGFVTVLVEYRIKSKDNIVSAEPCIEDGKSAIRWLRQHADEYGIDTDKIVAAGDSVGGHVALSTAVFDNLNEDNEEPTVSSKPNALILYCPVSDTTKSGFHAFMADSHIQLSVSPVHNLKNGLVPTIIFHGTADTTVSISNSEALENKIKEYGGRCTLVKIEGQNHNFFANTKPEIANPIREATDDFLNSIGFLKK